MDYKAEVHKAGRITIPIEIRKQFQIAEGDIGDPIVTEQKTTLDV